MHAKEIPTTSQKVKKTQADRGAAKFEARDP
jgi:hypothetical protein